MIPVFSAAILWVFAMSQLFFPQADQFSEALLVGHFRDLQGCLFGFFSLALGSWDLKMVTVCSQNSVCSAEWKGWMTSCTCTRKSSYGF